MVYDQFLPPQRRESARTTQGAEPVYQCLPGPHSTRSRRSSVSSFAESEVSIFSDVSVTSSQTSASSQPSSGWESSTPYDSDDDASSRAYEDHFSSDTQESFAGSSLDPAAALRKANNGFPPISDIPVETQMNGLGRRNFSFPELKNAENLVPIRRFSQPVTEKGCITERNANKQPTQLCGLSQFNYNPQHLSQSSSHPRRTTADPSWSKPSLVTQHERRVNFVENLVDAATQLVALIWPLAMTEVCTTGQRNMTPVITLRFFIRETLRRSRTSFSTLQVAMYYLSLLNHSNQISNSNHTLNPPLHCGRRMFLASLILASKYLQDRNYFTKAWSRISNLSIAEINKNEMALLSALEYKLHIKPCDFQTWTDGISKCTASVQLGLDCPWVEVLKAQKLWRPISTEHERLETSTAANSFTNKFGLCTDPKHQKGSVNEVTTCPRLLTVPEHRLGLARVGQAVNPTRPVPFSGRSCPMGKANMQWQGMASLLHNRSCGQSVTSERLRFLSQGLSQVSMQQRESPDQELSDGHEYSRPKSSLLSPPRTPESGNMIDTSTLTSSIGDGYNSDVDSNRGPPPTPKEPLLSLNTTPDSNDGASTFGNYLGVTDCSPSDFAADNAQPRQLPESTVARFQADTMDTAEADMPGVQAITPAMPKLRTEHASSTNRHLQRSIAAAVRAEIDPNQSDLVIMADDKPSWINNSVQQRTRYLLNEGPSKTSRSDPLMEHASVEPTRISQSDTKRKDASKSKHCHRRKRSAGSFSGEQAFSLRTKKVLRA